MITRPSFDLVDHHGRHVTLSTFSGRRCLVFFGFTHCKVVCPRALAKLTSALEELGEDGRDIQGLYISVDPERDTPQRLAQFLGPHPRFLGLTGSPDQAEAARESFGVCVRRRPDPDDPDGYALPHSALAYLLGADGEYADHWLDSASVDDLAAGLRLTKDKRSLVGRGDNVDQAKGSHCCQTAVTSEPGPHVGAGPIHRP